MQAQYNSLPLLSVKPGLDSSLANISRELEDYFSSGGGNQEALKKAIDELHRIGGVLRMLSLTGLVVFCAELEKLLQELTQTQGLSVARRDTITKALFGLTHYLDAIADGASNATLRLFYEYQEMLRARGQEMAFEVDLFFPALQVELPESVLQPPQGHDVLAQVKAARLQYQQALLKWLRQDGTAEALRVMTAAVRSVINTAPQNLQRAFWWVAGGLLDCLSQDGIPPELNVKKSLSRIDLKMKSLVDGTAAFDEEGAISEMLYLVARSHTVNDAVELIKETYALDEYLPEDRPLPPSETAALLDSMHAQLNVAEETWERCVTDDAAACQKFAVDMEKLHALSEQLDRNTLQFLCKQIHAISLHADEPERAQRIAMDMAMALLLLNGGIEHYRHLGSGFHEQTRIVSSRLQASMMRMPEDVNKLASLISLYCQMEQREVLAPLAIEMQGNLQQIEQSLNAFFNKAAKSGELTQINRLMNQVQGGMRILSLDVADQLLGILRQVTERYVQGETPSAGEMRAVAATISALEDYVGGLEHGQKPDPAALSSVLRDITEARATAGTEPAVVKEEAVPSGVSIRSGSEDEELLEVFLEEAREVLETLRENQEISRLHLESREPLVTMRRGFHTLKGSGRMVGLTELGEVAWAIERAMNKWLQDNKPATPALLDMIGDAEVLFQHWVDMLQSGSTSATIDTSHLLMVADCMENGKEIPQPQTKEHAPEPAVEVNEAESAEPEEEGNVEIGSVSLSRMLFDIATEEAAGHVQALYAQLQILHEAEPHLVTYDFMRAAHTLAGVNRTMGFVNIAELAYALELWLETRIDKPNVVNDEQIALIDEVVQCLDKLCAMVREQRQEPRSQPELIARLQADKEMASAETLSIELPTEEATAEPEQETAAATHDVVESVDLELPAQLPPEALASLAEISAESESVLDTLSTFVPLTEKVSEVQPQQQESAVANAMDMTDLLPQFQSFSELSVMLPVTRPSESGFTLDTLSAFVPPEEKVAESQSKEAEAAQLTEAEPQPVLELPNIPEEIAPEAEALPEIDLEFAEPRWKTAQALEVQPQEAAVENVAATDKAEAEPQPVLELPNIPAEIAPEAEALPEIVLEFAEPRWKTAQALEVQPQEAAVENVAATDKAEAESQVVAAKSAAVADKAKQEHHAAQKERTVHDEVDEQLLPIFLEEAHELYPQIGSTLRAWREKPGDGQLGRNLQRSLHTLKGSARMAGAMRLGELTHRVEDRVDKAVAGGTLNAELWSELDNYLDRIGNAIEQLQNPQIEVADTQAAAAVSPQKQFETTQIIAPQALEVGAERAMQAAMLRVRSDIVDRLVNEAGEVSVARSRVEMELREFKTSVQELTDSVNRLRKQLREIEIHAEGQMQARVSISGDSAERFDPLEFDRFTRFQELTRFMNESVHDVQTVQQTLLKNLAETEAALTAQSHLNRDLQQGLMGIRMVPFSSISERLYRTVRQTGKELGKRANLELSGTEVELDRSVLEKMTAPFEHLLRNAIAHGLETPEQRTQAKKDPIGEIRLALRQESNEVVFEFSDDGAGLDLAKVRAKAIENGDLNVGEEISDDLAMQLIFTPGLSTAQEVTEISGRGVGMDVVRSEITSLGGRIDMSSEPGLGMRFTIHLPLTLAVTKTLMVRVGHQVYALPSTMVENVQQLKPAALEATYQQQFIDWQGARYPLHYLARLLGDDEAEVVSQPHNPVLLLRAGENRIAVHVDELLGNHEVVVKNIGPQLARLPGIAGATVSGSGAVILIINPIAFTQRLSVARKITKSETVAEEVHVLPTVMVVDDSLTVRKITGRLLDRAGYQVLTAKDGVDALEQLTEVLPDVMLLDVEMPRMDGFELAKRLRQDSRTKNLPIIMITSRTADKHRQYALELGVNEYMGKPYQEDELLQHIARFIGKPS